MSDQNQTNDSKNKEEKNNSSEESSPKNTSNPDNIEEAMEAEANAEPLHTENQENSTKETAPTEQEDNSKKTSTDDNSPTEKAMVEESDASDAHNEKNSEEKNTAEAEPSEEKESEKPVADDSMQAENNDDNQAKDTADASSKPEVTGTESSEEKESEKPVADDSKQTGNNDEDQAADTAATSSKPKEAQDEIDDANAEDSEDEESHKRHEIEAKDYHALSMSELVRELDGLLKKEKVQAIREHVQEIRTEFDAKFEEEMEQKKEDFLEDGGNIIDFHYSTPQKKEFNSLYFDYKEKRNRHYQELKKNLNKNLEERLAIIEELKGMIGLGADMNANFNQFKNLQERWKKAGPVPRDQYKTVWNTYHHHVEHFYDFLHLDREFRDLDFKHNLEQKLKIIARAEELAQETDTNRSFRELQMLHKMWKEDLGPVAREYREDIWGRFSEATKQIHENRQGHFAELDKEREGNLEKKQEIIQKIEEIAAEDLKNHNQTQQKIKKIEVLREDFFKAGKVPRKVNEETWSQFKKAVRIFNRKKNGYYKDLKKDQYENLEKKKELIKIADEHKDSEDFKAVTPIMKKIQGDWKEIGHVPRKDSDKVWKKFKAACNHYFDRMHAVKGEENKEENEAFDKKKVLLDDAKKLELGDDHQENLKKIKEKIAAWKEVGSVPYAKRYIEGKFNKALDQLFKQIDVDRKDAEMMKYENRVQALDQADDDRRIQKEASFLRKKIQETKAELRQLENNMQFFSNVDENNPMMRDVLKNKERLTEQLGTWKAKLQKIRSL